MFRRFAQLSTRGVLAPGRLTRGGHEPPQFNEPGGYLFGRKPGVKYEEEGWEKPYFIGFPIAFMLIALGIYYKPDTRIRTWARAEAERQLREEGNYPTYKRTDYRA
ncbi:hypothetical protein GGF46_002076 [Coemansia sp. RSA 552]|nr:hypothetical protein GGF46_002076 [Coemansia sp. RSA 552]